MILFDINVNEQFLEVEIEAIPSSKTRRGEGECLFCDSAQVAADPSFMNDRVNAIHFALLL